MNKDLLEVLVVLGTTFVIISLRLKRKKAEVVKRYWQKILKRKIFKLGVLPLFALKQKFPS